MEDKSLTNFNAKLAIINAFPNMPNIKKVANEYVEEGYWDDKASIEDNLNGFQADYTGHEGMFRDPSLYEQKPVAYTYQIERNGGNTSILKQRFTHDDAVTVMHLSAWQFIHDTKLPHKGIMTHISPEKIEICFDCYLCFEYKIVPIFD